MGSEDQAEAGVSASFWGCIELSETPGCGAGEMDGTSLLSFHQISSYFICTPVYGHSLASMTSRASDTCGDILLARVCYGRRPGYPSSHISCKDREKLTCALGGRMLHQEALVSGGVTRSCLGLPLFPSSPAYLGPIPSQVWPLHCLT